MTTKTATHTPGLWHFSNAHIWRWQDKDRDDGEIAFINHKHPDCDANGQLIAAAPDLLACCKSVLLRLDIEADHLGGDNPEFLCSTKRDMLRTAITAAEGAMT